MRCELCRDSGLVEDVGSGISLVCGCDEIRVGDRVVVVRPGSLAVVGDEFTVRKIEDGPYGRLHFTEKWTFLRSEIERVR